MSKPKPEDPMGAALTEAEAVQRASLKAAEEAVRDALEALRPFEVHEGRVLAGIETAVRDVRTRLTDAAGNLATIVTLHLDGEKKKPEPNPIESAVDTDHAERVRLLRESA